MPPETVAEHRMVSHHNRAAILCAFLPPVSHHSDSSYCVPSYQKLQQYICTFGPVALQLFAAPHHGTGLEIAGCASRATFPSRPTVSRSCDANVGGKNGAIYIKRLSLGCWACPDMPCVKLLSRKYQCLVRQRC